MSYAAGCRFESGRGLVMGGIYKPPKGGEVVVVGLPRWKEQPRHESRRDRVRRIRAAAASRAPRSVVEVSADAGARAQAGSSSGSVSETEGGS